MKRIRVFAFPMTVAMLTAGSIAVAQWAIEPFTVAGGGGRSVGGALTLTDTIAQPAAGVMTGEAIALAGGFWPAASVSTTSWPGNADGDGDLDTFDYAIFAECLFGPGRTPEPEPPLTARSCLEVFDLDGDGDVDFFDYEGFQTRFGR